METIIARLLAERAAGILPAFPGYQLAGKTQAAG